MQKQKLSLAHTVAQAVFPSSQATSTEIIEALALPSHQAVLLVVGAAGNLRPELRPLLAPLFDAVAQLAHNTKTVLLSGGTQAGVMGLLGEAVARHALPPALVGVAPAALVYYPNGPANGAPLEPHHSHFVLTTGQNWGDETATLFALTAGLAGPPAARRPAAVLLAGGGGIARNEIVQAARHRLPVLVITGTGGLADELAAAWPHRHTLSQEAKLAEILADGQLRFFPLEGAPAALAQALRALVQEG